MNALQNFTMRPKMIKHTRTREEVLAAFEAQGLSVTEWAAAHGFRREDVYAVLGGRTRGRRGEAHRIAVALGIKPSVERSLMDGQVGPENAGLTREH
jgi:gp16 family phage-associated protein